MNRDGQLSFAKVSGSLARILMKSLETPKILESVRCNGWSWRFSGTNLGTNGSSHWSISLQTQWFGTKNMDDHGNGISRWFPLNFCHFWAGFSVGGRGVETSGHCSICSTGGDDVSKWDFGVEVRCWFGTGLIFERVFWDLFPDFFTEFAYLAKGNPSSLDHKTSSSKPNFYSWCDDCPPKDSDRWCKELDSNYFQPFTLKSVICMSELDEHHPCPIVFLLDSPFWWQLGTQQLNFVTDTCLDVHMFLFSTDATDMSQCHRLRLVVIEV